MDLRRIGFAGAAREDALKLAEDKLNEVLDAVEEAGPNANIALAAKLAGVSRTLIYRRLRERAENRRVAAGYAVGGEVQS